MPSCWSNMRYAKTTVKLRIGRLSTPRLGPGSLKLCESCSAICGHEQLRHRILSSTAHCYCWAECVNAVGVSVRCPDACATLTQNVKLVGFCPILRLVSCDVHSWFHLGYSLLCHGKWASLGLVLSAMHLWFCAEELSLPVATPEA